MKSFDRVIAISVDRLDAVSVMYWLIQRGSFARLSARANLCCVAVSRGRAKRRRRRYLVRKHHEPPVRLSAQDTPDALRGVPHRVEAEEL